MSNGEDPQSKDRSEESESPKHESSAGGRARSFTRRHPRAKWIVPLAIVIAVVVVYELWSYYSVRASTDDAHIHGHIHPISARVGGPVIAVHVDENEYHEGGTVLVQIDPRDYEVALERAQADLMEAQAALDASQTSVPITSTRATSELTGSEAGVRQAQASLAAAQRQLSMQESQLSSARAQLQQAEANYEKASRDLERMKMLIAKEEISQQQFDAAQSSAQALQAVVASARAAVSGAEAGVRISESQVQVAEAKVGQAQAAESAAKTGPQRVSVSRSEARSAEARVKRAQAAVDQARLNLEYTTIKAPVGGIISKRNVEVGQVVQPGQPLMAIVPLEDIWVTANFKETELKDLRVGQPATISVDAYDRDYRGHVESFSAATGAQFSLLPPENATGNYVKVVQRVPVRIAIEKGQDTEHRLRLGLSVVATVLTAEDDEGKDQEEQN